MTQAQISNKHQVAYTTFRRYLRKQKLHLTAAQIRERHSRAALRGRAKRDHPGQSHRCEPDCDCKRHHNRRRRRTDTPTVVLGRRFCSDCKHWRHIFDFHAREWDVDGNPVGFQAICKTCQRIRCRINSGMKRRGRPYEPRKPRRTHEEQLERARELYREHCENPEWLEMRREYERIYAEAKRREAGIPRDEAKMAKRKAGVDVTISVIPFALWQEERIPFYDSWADLAAACGTSDRQLRRTRFNEKGELEQPTVRADFVDACLQHEGSTTIVTLYSGNIYNKDEQQLALAA